MARSRDGLLVLGKYLLLQLPGWLIVGALGWAAHRWLGLHPWLAAGALVAFMVKDAVLFPFVRQAYSIHARPAVEPLLGARAVAVDPLAPDGFVRVGHELWRARLAPGEPPLAAGVEVRIESLDGLTLRVRAADADRGRAS